MSTARQIAANISNAGFSTGPRSSEGKAASSRNNFKFGLTGNTFLVLSWEKQEEFDELRKKLIAEHQPSTPTEELLVEQMSRHAWLGLRAGFLQGFCFRQDVAVCDEEKKLALYLHYQAMHERAFEKSLNQLLKLRAERHRERLDEAALSQRAENLKNGFELQNHKRARECARQEMHESRLRLMDARLATLQARIPAHLSAAPPPKTGCQAIHQEAA